MIKKTFLPFLMLLALLGRPAFGQGAKVGDDGFKSFMTEFQVAVAKNDQEKIVALSNFPHFNWEEGLGDDVSRETFLKNFQKLMSPEIRQKIASGKYYKTKYGDYFIDWNQKGNQYSLVFDHQPNGGFKFSGLLVGPAD